MRNVLFFILLIFSLSASAQYFSLKESGLVPANGSEDKFIVVEKEGKTQKELFNQIKGFITASYVSPKDVMSENGEEMITLNGISDGDVTCKKALGMLSFKTNYTIVFMFKDGKIRINAPSINSMTAESMTLGGGLGSLYELTLTKDYSVSNGREQIVVFKNGGKTTKGAKESIEELFNTLIEKVINFTPPTAEKW